MEIIEVPIGQVKPCPVNAKKHNATQIKNVAQSIKEFGFVQPLVLDDDNEVIIGHCRLLAAKSLKMETVPCVYARELTPEQVAKLRNLDNKLNESEWDIDLLREQVSVLDFSEYEDIDWGIPPEEPEIEDIIEDNPPEPDEVETRCKPGDVWILGDHRLVCGDSTDPDVIDKAMGGGQQTFSLQTRRTTSHIRRKRGAYRTTIWATPPSTTSCWTRSAP